MEIERDVPSCGAKVEREVRTLGGVKPPLDDSPTE
jgi:hypothetical protein